MEIGILGPLEVRAGGRAVQITGSRLRALVTRLALDAPAAVSTAELVDAVWPADPPAEPMNALAVLDLPGPPGARLSRARSSRWPAVTGWRSIAGRWTPRPSPIWSPPVAGSCATATAQTARDTLVKALSLWRGTPLADAGDAGYAAGADRPGWHEQRLDAQADRIEAELRLGRGGDVIADLEALVAAQPAAGTIRRHS